VIAVLLFAAALAATPAELSPEARSAIAPVLDAIAAERAAQAKLPTAKDDAERLVRLGKLDQAPRLAFPKVDMTKAPEAERALAGKALGAAVNALDAEIQAQVLGMVPPEGWFTRSRYGAEASKAAFMIIQHSSVESWRRFLPVIQPLVATGEVDGEAFALMYDRLEVTEGRPQRYGSQFRCRGGGFESFPLEDATRVEAWRKEAGMPTSYADHLANLAGAPC
jgi:hypothetical protein